MLKAMRIPLVFLLGIAVLGDFTRADDPVREAEAKRIAVIDKIRPAVVAVFANGGQGGGSGVLIDPEGFALTNFHVVQGVGPTMQCGLADGVLYDAVLVGLDKVGDVALIKLLPKEKDKPFPFVALGDSDQVKPGDWSLAMGNPFLLATDFTPTVTFGMISGVNRYQYPAGTLLEYTDCIQIDTSINPGNSGGPLFNMAGELIGINGRGSFEKRGRVNSGVGYAISINQIKNFLGHFYAGIDTDHATLGAIVKTVENDDDPTPRMMVQTVLDECDAARRGLQPEDVLVEFAGRPVFSVNQYKNVLGIYPKGWRLPLTYRRDNVKHEILVRLEGLMRKDEMEPEGRPRPGRPPRPPGPQPKRNAEAMKLYKAKPGFANYYFNEQAQAKLLDNFKKHGEFAALNGNWLLTGDIVRKALKTPFKAELVENAEGKFTAGIDLGGVLFTLDPLKSNPDPRELRDPPGSGGLLMGLYNWHRLLTLGAKGFEGGFTHGGHEPWYPPPVDDRPTRWAERRIDCEVLHTEHAAVHAKWYYAKSDHKLIGAEIWLSPTEDPCELYFSDYREVNGRMLPHDILVRIGDVDFGRMQIKSYQLNIK
jgi:S1-C subfamily serine protease